MTTDIKMCIHTSKRQTMLASQHGDDGPTGANTNAVVQNYTRKATFLTPLTTGDYTLEIRYDNWNLSGVVPGQGITFKLSSDSGGSVNLLFDWRSTDNIRTRHAVTGPVIGTAAQKGNLTDTGSELIVQVNGNLDSGAFTTSYSTNGGTSFSNLIIDGGGLTSINEIIWTVEGTTAWAAGDFIDIDYIQLDLTPVPEPATVALLFGFFALGIVVIRRRK